MSPMVAWISPSRGEPADAASASSSASCRWLRVASDFALPNRAREKSGAMASARS